jgi:hypothetical protein
VCVKVCEHNLAVKESRVAAVEAMSGALADRDRDGPAVGFTVPRCGEQGPPYRLITARSHMSPP